MTVISFKILIIQWNHLTNLKLLSASLQDQGSAGKRRVIIIGRYKLTCCISTVDFAFPRIIFDQLLHIHFNVVTGFASASIQQRLVLRTWINNDQPTCVVGSR
jgi:hypothetical protein